MLIVNEMKLQDESHVGWNNWKLQEHVYHLSKYDIYQDHQDDQLDVKWERTNEARNLQRSVSSLDITFGRHFWEKMASNKP